MFNPPYVPTTSDEHKAASSTIVASWSGGRLGREVRLLCWFFGSVKSYKLVVPNLPAGISIFLVFFR